MSKKYKQNMWRKTKTEIYNELYMVQKQDTRRSILSISLVFIVHNICVLKYEHFVVCELENIFKTTSKRNYMAPAAFN